MRLMRFNAIVRHVPGKDLVIADTLSRKPLPHTSDDEVKEDQVAEYVEAVESLWPASDSGLGKIRTATAQDPVLQTVVTYINQGWPQNVSLQLRPYQQVQGQLSIVEGIIALGNRIIVPHAMQQEILHKIHESHQGYVKCQERARSAVWWPGITKEIEALVSACHFCRVHRPSQRQEPLILSPLPDRPWEKIAVDLCEKEKANYMITVDYYSRWIEITKLGSTSSNAIIEKLKDIFSTHGYPDVLQSDNGPQFASSQFKDFADNCNFRHVTSSPHMHQANGLVERAVQTSKRILENKDPKLALLNYRTTPHTTTGVSPSELLMGRQLKTKLPTLSENLRLQFVDRDRIAEKDKIMKQKQKLHYDRRHGSKDMKPLQPGENVLLKLDHEKTWRNEGKVILADPSNRTYLVNTPMSTVRRNRIHLQPSEDEPETKPEPKPRPEPETVPEPEIQLKAGNSKTITP